MGWNQIETRIKLAWSIATNSKSKEFLKNHSISEKNTKNCLDLDSGGSIDTNKKK